MAPAGQNDGLAASPHAADEPPDLLLQIPRPLFFEGSCQRLEGAWLVDCVLHVHVLLTLWVEITRLVAVWRSLFSCVAFRKGLRLAKMFR